MPVEKFCLFLATMVIDHEGETKDEGRRRVGGEMKERQRIYSVGQKNLNVTKLYISAFMSPIITFYMTIGAVMLHKEAVNKANRADDASSVVCGKLCAMCFPRLLKRRDRPTYERTDLRTDLRTDGQTLL